MLVLKTSIRSPVGLHFSPCGTGLLAFSSAAVQVWRDWRNEPALRVAKPGTDIERAALGPGVAHALLYLSGNSRTKLLDVATGEVRATVVPEGGPAWPHFDAAGGYVISSHSRGKLSRFDYDPAHADVLREVWQIARKGGKGGKTSIGTHYRFGAVCGPTGALVGLEYRHGGSEPFDALAVRAAADGALVSREVLKSADYNWLLSKAGLRLAVHPSGRYFAYPNGPAVQFHKLSGKTPDPIALPKLDEPPPKRKPKPKANAKPAKRAKPKADPPPRNECASVAFSPDGAFLLAGRTDGAVTLFDARSWEPLRTLDWRVGELKAVQFAPDGTRAAAIGTKGKVVVWDVDV